MTRTPYYQIVRDQIPDIIRASGKTPSTRIIEKKDILPNLINKLLEEASEVDSSDPQKLPEELGDLVEVIQAIAKEAGISWEQVLREQRRKREEKGGFTKGIFLEYTKG